MHTMGSAGIDRGGADGRRLAPGGSEEVVEGTSLQGLVRGSAGYLLSPLT